MAHPTPLEALRAAVAADLPLAPVHAAMHARLCSVEAGRTAARMPLPPGAGTLDALGTLLVLADFVLGIVVSTVLDPGTTITTVRLSAQVTSGAHLTATGTLAAAARLEHLGGGTGESSAEIRADDGGLLARLQARNMVLDAPRLRDPYDSGSAEPVRPERPVPWATLVAMRHDGGLLRAAPDPRSANSADSVQGGVVAGIAARALAEALGAPPDDLVVTYLRPTPGDGSTLDCHTVTERVGRRLGSARTELRRGDRALVSASGAAYH